MHFLINHFKRILRDHGITDFEFIDVGEDVDLIIKSKLPVDLDGKILQAKVEEDSIYSKKYDVSQRCTVDVVEVSYEDLAAPYITPDGSPAIKISLTNKNYVAKLSKLESLLIHNPVYKPAII